VNERYRLAWAPVAIEDLDNILDFVALREGVDAAIALYRSLSERIDSLFIHPQRCRIVPELERFGIRSYREFIATPYRVFFRVEGGRVYILAVLDARRDLEQLLIHRLLETEPNTEDFR
jgi:toxin ParE1/3/4